MWASAVSLGRRCRPALPRAARLEFAVFQKVNVFDSWETEWGAVGGVKFEIQSSVPLGGRRMARGSAWVRTQVWHEVFSEPVPPLYSARHTPWGKLPPRDPTFQRDRPSSACGLWPTRPVRAFLLRFHLLRVPDVLLCTTARCF